MYSHLYLAKRANNTPRLSANQGQALPWIALWNVAISLPLLLPAVLGAAPFQVQDGVVIWFLLPLTLSPFQDLVSYLIASSGCGSVFKSPIRVAYWIVGVVSGVVHVGVALWAFVAPGLSWSRIYWPNHGAVQHGPTFMTEGATLFMQYDHAVIYLCVLGLGAYMLGFDDILAAVSGAERLRAARPLLKLTAMTVIAGPGAGLSWLLCHREKQMEAVDAQSKQF